MRINKKMINILPLLLKRLSNGDSLHLPSVAEEFSIPKNTLVNNLKEIISPLFPKDIFYDNSTKNWYAKKNFLSETLLSADELITIKLLEKYSEQLGENFNTSSKKLFKRFKQQASLTIFRKSNIELINRRGERKFALLEYAISNNSILRCNYKTKARTIYPLKIAMLEGYWYLFLIEEGHDEEIRKYHLQTIEKLKLTKEKFKRPPTDTLNGLKNAINAYFNSQKRIYVELLVHKNISPYLKRKPLSPAQHMERVDENYEKLTITITDEREIIPTIQQYLPYIKVLSPDSLHQKIEENIANYSNLNI